MEEKYNPTKSFTYQGPDGFNIAAYAWLPKTDQTSWKGIVQIAHGMAEHALRYGRFAQTLNDQGYAVYANDHRGHGKTISKPNERGFFAKNNGWSLVIEDLHFLNTKIKDNHPSLPIYLFAHSMGTFISQQYISEYPDTIKGIILSASIDSAGPLRLIGLAIAKMERLRIGARGQSKLLNAMSFGGFNKSFKPNRTEYDWISQDKIEVDKYINDPLCGFMVTTQLWVDLLQGLGLMAQESTRKLVTKTLPILLITGDHDPVTQNGRAVDKLKIAYEKAGIENISVKKYTDGRHESLNEINRDTVTSDIITWLDQLKA